VLSLLLLSWLSFNAHNMWLKMYLGTFVFSWVMIKCKNTLCSNEGWSTPPHLGRKHPIIIFWSILCSFCISQYFPFFVMLNIVMFTTSIQGLFLLSKFSSKEPSAALLQALAIISSKLETGIPMMLERISVQMNGFKPSCSLVFPSRVGSIRTFSCSSNLTTWLS